MHSFTNWVMEFDPVNFMNSADAANIQVMDRAEEEKFKDYTDKVLQDLKSNKTVASQGGPNQMGKLLNKKQSKEHLVSSKL